MATAQPFQCIIYHKPSGKILSALPNKYIRHRSELIPYSQAHPLQEVGFFYEHPETHVDHLNDRIKQITSGSPPQVFSSLGSPKSFTAFLNSREYKLSQANTIITLFEGGMGDQVLQTEAVLQFQKNFPHKTIFPSVYERYHPIIQNMAGLNHVLNRSQPQTKIKPDAIVDNHTQYISDPRGMLYGKASLYGASLGLHKVTQKASLKIPLEDRFAFLDSLALPLENYSHPFLGLHIRSGSGHAKSWNTEPAELLARLVIQKFASTVFLFGDQKDWQIHHEKAIRIGPPLSWYQTACAISALNLLVCIDSGPMHLARSLGIPHLILWGGTSFRDILGRNQEPHDLIDREECGDRICYNCPKGIPRCMKAHDVSKIFSMVEGIFLSQHKKLKITSPPSMEPTAHEPGTPQPRL